MVIITEEIDPELAVIGAYQDAHFMGVKLQMKLLEGKKNVDGYTFLGNC
jgi:hypothetical protein